MTYTEHRRDLCPQESGQVSLTKGQPSSGQGYTWADKSMRLKGHTCEPTYIIRPQQSHGVKTHKKVKKEKDNNKKRRLNLITKLDTTKYFNYDCIISNKFYGGWGEDIRE